MTRARAFLSKVNLPLTLTSSTSALASSGVAEYNEEAYILMQWKGICRLQKFEDMMKYKQKEVELEYVPIYPEDLKDQTVLSEKLEQGVNIIHLFRDYTDVNEINPVEDVQLVFDNIRYIYDDESDDNNTESIINRYFDEAIYFEFMARKAGQDVTEFLNGRNLEATWYQRVYKQIQKPPVSAYS